MNLGVTYYMKKIFPGSNSPLAKLAEEGGVDGTAEGATISDSSCPKYISRSANDPVGGAVNRI